MPIISVMRARNDLWTLLDASWTTDSGGLEKYLHAVVDTCAHAFQASGASLFVATDDAITFRLVAKAGTESRIPEDATLFAGDGIAGAAILRKSPLLVDDPSSDPELQRRGVTRRDDLVSAMIVPLVTHEGGCVGVLNVSRATGQEPFTKRDLRKAKTIAAHVALAVSNAMLFEKMDLAARQAREANARLRTVLDCLGVGMLILDPEGFVVQRNLQLCAMIGVGASPGLTWEEALQYAPEALKPALREVVRAALLGQGIRRQVFDPADGRSWRLVGSPMRVGIALAVEDVTDIDRAQREAARSKRLAEIGQMTAAIAHEIRNPLTGIRSAAQMVQAVSDEGAEFGRMIEEEALKLNALCDDFLEFARPLALHIDDVRLDEVAERIVTHLRETFASAGVSLSLEIQGSPPTIQGDGRRIEQVLHNLLRNALEASSDGGEVKVCIDGARVTVSDRGVGMDDEASNSLFTPFFTTKASGTGLGLSNVRKIVDAHGGRIQVRSVPGEGTEFEVEFEVRLAA